MCCLRSGQRTVKGSTALHREIERHFCAFLDHVCVEAFLLIGRKLVGERSCGCEAGESAQQGEEREEELHVGEL